MKEKEIVGKAMREFIIENTILKKGGIITKEEFKNRCPFGQKTACNVLASMNVISIRMYINGKQRRVFYGITWKDSIE